MLIGRDDVVDVLLGDDEAVVLTSRQCLRLTALSAAIVAFLVEPRPEVEVLAHLEDLFGPAPDGRLEQVLDELTHQGLIQVTSETVSSD